MNTQKLTNVGLLMAVSLVLMVTVAIPLFQPFLIYEPGDIPLLIITFLYGPMTALGATFVLSIIMALFTGLGGPFGAVMHMLATGVLVGVAGYFYHRSRTLQNGIIGLVLGSLAMTGVMAVANVILDPIFYGIPRQRVINLLLPAIIPFNLVKSAANSVITLLVYKKLANYLLDDKLESTTGEDIEQP
ncbi:MAG: ECF transporter S component [Bacillota bacterium]